MLPQSFYQQDAVLLAQALIGHTLIHNTPDGITAGIIVETEAYRQDDQASHSFRGMTKRNAVMFGQAGHAYIYFTYGMHYCMNVVAGEEGSAEAVLIRALEPVQGLKLMRQRRRIDDIHNLCSGPAKLVQALGLQKEQNGIEITSGTLHIASDNPTALPVASTPRIGIKQAIEKPWRFIAAGSEFITKHSLNKRARPVT